MGNCGPQQPVWSEPQRRVKRNRSVCNPSITRLHHRRQRHRSLEAVGPSELYRLRLSGLLGLSEQHLPQRDEQLGCRVG